MIQRNDAGIIDLEVPVLLQEHIQGLSMQHLT